MTHRTGTNEQRKAMLTAIRERAGTWGDVDAESQIIDIGRDIGLTEDETLETFKQVVNDDYVDTGRNLQVPPFSSERAGQWVGAGRIDVMVNRDMRLTDKGQAEIR